MATKINGNKMRKLNKLYRKAMGVRSVNGVKMMEKVAVVIQYLGGSSYGTKQAKIELCLSLMMAGNKARVPQEKRAPSHRVKNAMTTAQKKAFYASWEWRELRYSVLLSQGRQCACCGWKVGDPGDNGPICVDHIKPISKYPELRLTFSNMQTLCSACNQGKSNKYENDFRADDSSADTEPDEFWMDEAYSWTIQ